MPRPPSIFVEHQGKRLSLRDLAKATGHTFHCIDWRYHRRGLRGDALVAQPYGGKALHRVVYPTRRRPV